MARAWPRAGARPAMLAASVVLLASLLGVAPRAAGWCSAAQHEAAAAAGAAGARAAREACARQALWAPLGPFYFYQKPFTLEECRVAGVSAADPDVAGEWRLLRVPNVVLTPGGTAKFVMPKQALPRGAPVLQFANGLAFPSVGGSDSTFGASDNAGGDEYYTEPLGLAQGMHLHHSRTIACAALRRDERAWQALASAFGSDGLLATEQRIRCGGYHTVSDWECGEGDVDGACTEDRFAYLHFVLPPGYGDYSGDWLGSFMVDVHLEDLREGGGNRSVDVVQQFFLADPAAAKAHGLRQTYIAVHGFRPDYRDSAVAKTRASSRARSSLEVSAQTRSTGRRKLAGGPNLTYRVKSSNRTSLYWTSFRFARDGRIVTVRFHAHTNTDTTLLFQATPHQLGLLKAKAASWYDFDGEYGGADRAVLAPGDGSVASARAHLIEARPRLERGLGELGANTSRAPPSALLCEYTPLASDIDERSRYNPRANAACAVSLSNVSFRAGDTITAVGLHPPTSHDFFAHLVQHFAIAFDDVAPDDEVAAG